MNRLFNPDNPIMQFISKIFDLIVLNLIFIFSCVPVITIGASLTGLYYVSLKILRGDDPYIWQNFWKAFRQNFKQATLLWLLAIAIFIFIAMDFYIINSADTTAFAILRVGLWIISALLLSMFIYLFPIISHFVCTTRQALKNSLLMTIGYLPYTVIFLAIYGVILYLCSHTPQTFAMVVVVSGVCGFSVVAFTLSIFFDKIFQQYEPEKEPEAEYPDM